MYDLFVKFLSVFFPLLLCLSSPALAKNVEQDEKSCLTAIEGVEIISSEQLIALVQKEERFVILDVRQESEWLAGHIDSSVNIPVAALTEKALSELVEKNEPVIVYCDGISCHRSMEAVKKIISLGWKNIFWLQGGLAEWGRQGYPQVKGLK